MGINRLESRTPPAQGFPKAYENDLTNYGKVDASLYDETELTHIYSIIGNRQHERNVLLGNTLATYTNWTHVQTEDQYGIWSYPVSDFTDATDNQLFRNYIELEYQGEADSELSAVGFTSVFSGNNAKTGEVFTDVTTEAGSASGTPFTLATSTSRSETLSGIDYTATSLAYNNIIEGTLVVTTSGGASPFVTYTEDTDYTVDYSIGEVTALSGGSIVSGSALLFTYDVGNSIYIGLSSAIFSNITYGLATKGVSNVYSFEYSSGSGFNSFTPTTDRTNNLSTNGNITLGTLSGWATTAVNSATNYWIRMNLTVDGTIAPTCFNIYNSDSSVRNLLKTTYNDILDFNYKWCYYSSAVYVTIPNVGASNQEGIKYITNSSSTTAKQNYFIYNNEYLTNYRNTISSSDIIFTGDLTVSGTVTASTFTDGTFIVTGGSLSATTITDGTTTLSGGTVSGVDHLYVDRVHSKGSKIYVESEVDGGSTVAEFGSLTLTAGGIEQQVTSDDAGAIRINYNGYHGGTTYFRDFNVFDGKNAAVFSIDGSSKAITCYGAVTGVTTLGCDSVEGATNLTLKANNGYTILRTSAGQHSYIDAGGNFLFRDFDSAYATRLTIDSSNGNITATGAVSGVTDYAGGAVFNETGADVDFRVEADTNSYALFVQGSDGNVAMGTSTPITDAKLTLGGDGDVALSFKRTGGGQFDNAILASGGRLDFLGGVDSATVAGLNTLLSIASTGAVTFAGAVTGITTLGCTGAVGIVASAVTEEPYSASKLYLESTGEVFIEFLADAAETNTQGILWSDGTTGIGRIDYTHSTDTLRLKAGGTDQLLLTSTSATFAGAVTGISTLGTTGTITVQSSAVTGGAANTNSGLILERNGEMYLSFRTRNTDAPGIMWGDPEDNNVGMILYAHSTNTMGFTAGATNILNLTSTGADFNSKAVSGVTTLNQIGVHTVELPASASTEYATRLRNEYVAGYSGAVALGMGVGTAEYSKQAIIADITTNYARGNLYLCVDSAADANSADISDAVLTLSQDKSATFAGAVDGITTLGIGGTLTGATSIDCSDIIRQAKAGVVYTAIELYNSQAGAANNRMSITPQFKDTGGNKREGGFVQFKMTACNGVDDIDTSIIFGAHDGASNVQVLELAYDKSATFAGAVSGITTLGLSGDLTNSAGNVIVSNGNITITEPTASTYGLTINGTNATDSFGLRVNAGTDASDYCIRGRNKDDAADLFTVNGAGDATFAGTLGITSKTTTDVNAIDYSVNTSVGTSFEDVYDYVKTVGMLFFASWYNLSGGSQGTELMMYNGGGLTSISSDDNSGAGVSFQVSGGQLQAKTTSGSVKMYVSAIEHG